jgi:arylsulfatase
LSRSSDPPSIGLSYDDGQKACVTEQRTSVPAAHAASETFDVGVGLGSPVSLDYYDRAPFRFTGEIEKIHIGYIE